MFKPLRVPRHLVLAGKCLLVKGRLMKSLAEGEVDGDAVASDNKGKYQKGVSRNHGH